MFVNRLTFLGSLISLSLLNFKTFLSLVWPKVLDSVFFFPKHLLKSNELEYYEYSLQTLKPFIIISGRINFSITTFNNPANSVQINSSV